MDQRQRNGVDEALIDAVATYAMDLQRVLRRYTGTDDCRCPEPCRRCDALALLDADS